MGIIRAIGQAIGGTLADQWLEVIEADDMRIPREQATQFPMVRSSMFMTISS